MPYPLPAHGFSVFFSPKAGGTSLRAYLYHLENGFPFPDCTVAGRPFDVNHLLSNQKMRYVDLSLMGDLDLYAVVRDPINRFLSGYANRVLHYRELSYEVVGDALTAKRLQPDPDIDLFVRRFRGYCAVSRSIRRHMSTQQRFLGSDPKIFRRIYKLERIPEMVDDLNRRTGVEGVMPRLQTGGVKPRFEDLAPVTQARLLELVKEDIAYRIHPDYADGIDFDKAA